MGVYFRDLDTTRDWRLLVEELSLSAASALVSWNPANLYKGVRDAVTKSAPNPGIDERAGVWLRVTATRALLSLLNDPRFGGPLGQNDARKDAARTFIAELLSLNGFDRLDQSVVINPGGAPVMAEVLAELPRLVRTGAELDVDDAAITARYVELLRSTSARVHALDTEFYRPLVDALDSTFSKGQQRDLAWAAHANWIVSLFREEPIFSLDRSETIPLSATYHRLRCYWHEEQEDDDPDEVLVELGAIVKTAYVGELHETLNAWLGRASRRDRIRVITGGLGSGKSSFSRAFATEVIEDGAHRVLYIQLQNMALGDDLWRIIGTHLRRRHGHFAENPLDWAREDRPRLLLVFDGLDDLSHRDDEATELARQFIFSVSKLVSALETTCEDVRAIVLGRNEACRQALDKINLDRICLIHVGPLTPITKEMLQEPRFISDEDGLADHDERPDFWRRSARARGQPDDPVPEAVTAEELNELNAEPLLLHLLIASGYTGENWHRAAQNRNRVYASIFRTIYERDQDKPNPPDLTQPEFFTLLECLGLAAWRGNGRTGSDEDFRAIREVHCTARQKARFGDNPSAELSGIAVQFYTRPDIERRGFEFIHKSFGEYLTARALLAAARRLAEENRRDESKVALKWTRLVGCAELNEEVIRFLADEAHLIKLEHAEVALEPLARLFNWTLSKGMPAHRAEPDAAYRRLETLQRCSESALLAVLNAIVSLVRSNRERSTVTSAGLMAPTSPGHFLARIHATSGHPVRLVVGCLDLANADLRKLNLEEADLTGAHLEGADLREAHLRCAKMVGAQLRGADLFRADLFRAELDGADLNSSNLGSAFMARAKLRSANLSGANLGYAILSGANLTGAYLDSENGRRTYLHGAHLEQANLSNVNFAQADLTEANVSEADLSGADLSWANLDKWKCRQASLRSASFGRSTSLSYQSVESAFGVKEGIGKTWLPSGMSYPTHWHRASEKYRWDSPKALQEYQAAYKAWRASAN